MVNIITSYRRFENESDEELIYRITGEKDKIGSWQEVANILNELLGTEYTESKFRKQRQAFDKMLTANRSKYVDSNAQLQEITLAQRELEKERKKIQTEKLEYNKWLREEARDEMITEKICSSIATLPPVKVPEYIKPVHNNKSYLLALADCHYGIEFSIKDFFGNIINEYSPEIFEDRMWDLYNQVVEIIHDRGIEELNVWELGDGIQGLLRLNSQLMQLRYGVIDSATRYGDFLAKWINALSKYVRVKFQMTMDSNHNQLRLCGAPKNAFSDENMSKVIMLMIKYQLADNPNVTIIENPTGMNFGMFSTHQILGIHGEVKDLGKALNDYSRAYDTPISYIIGAHIHHLTSKEMGINAEALSVRSMIGVDPYGMSLLATSNAGASLYEFDQLKGLTCEHKLKVN